jgi:hypothetical protein
MNVFRVVDLCQNKGSPYVRLAVQFASTATGATTVALAVKISGNTHALR